MADNSFKRFIKLLAKKLKSFLFAKDVLSFLLFVLLSASFWFFNALDKNREITIDVPVRFVNVPRDISYINDIPDHISVNIRDEGIHLFSYAKARLKPMNIEPVNNYGIKGQFVINAGQLNRQLQSYLLPTTNIIEIKPDSLLIKYEKLAVKKLPVVLISKIELKPQYMLSNRIRINPAYINVFGPANIIDTLKNIKTELLEIKNLNDTTSFKCKLKNVDFVKFSADNVNVSLYVEMFTEKTVELNVEAVNNPQNLNIRTFPAIVKATFNIGISRFSTFENKDLRVIIDYNDLKQSKNTKYKLKTLNNATFINNVRILPEEVEFILEE
jgi:hypothetical protein